MALQAISPIPSSLQLLMFVLSGQTYGVRLDRVERVVRAVAILPLPQAPPVILGVINMRGRIIPVADIRARFHLSARALSTRDHLMIVRSHRRLVALLVDEVAHILDCPSAAISAAAEILPDLPYVSGVARLADGAVIIHDIDRFLSLDEESQLETALAGGPDGA